MRKDLCKFLLKRLISRYVRNTITQFYMQISQCVITTLQLARLLSKNNNIAGEDTWGIVRQIHIITGGISSVVPQPRTRTATASSHHTDGFLAGWAETSLPRRLHGVYWSTVHGQGGESPGLHQQREEPQAGTAIKSAAGVAVRVTMLSQAQKDKELMLSSPR